MTQFTDQQIDIAFDAAPEEVKEVILSGTLSNHVIEIAEKHQLHIDLMEPLAAHGRNMLIGLLPPTQFVAELKAAGIADQTANAILQDLNEQVFKPLHEKIRVEKGTPASEPTKVAVSVTPKPPAPPVSVPPRPATLEPKLPMSVPVPPPKPALPTPPPSPVQAIPAPPPLPAQVFSTASSTMATSPVPQMRTMTHDVEVLKEGKMPTPIPAPITRPVPPASPAPLPPQESTGNIPTHKEVSDTLKTYGIDPYREPVE